MILELKILPEYFNAIKSGQKTFEIRYNDRNYRPGDVLLLKEWNGFFSGKEIFVAIRYITFLFDFLYGHNHKAWFYPVKIINYVSYSYKYFFPAEKAIPFFEE